MSLKYVSAKSTITVFLSKTVKKKQNFGIMKREFNYPIRMCIICKSRLRQSNLFRYQIKQKDIVAYMGAGRSFYLCETCLKKDEDKLKKVLCGRFKLEIENCGKKLKEIATNGR